MTLNKIVVLYTFSKTNRDILCYLLLILKSDNIKTCKACLEIKHCFEIWLLQSPFPELTLTTVPESVS